MTKLGDSSIPQIFGRTDTCFPWQKIPYLPDIVTLVAGETHALEYFCCQLGCHQRKQ